MTMNCRGFLKAVRHPLSQTIERAMGREHGERKPDEMRCDAAALTRYHS
jgi:hypothetical protein